MSKHIAIYLVITGLATAAMAQAGRSVPPAAAGGPISATPAAAASATAETVGTIVGTNINVRSGPGEGHYACVTVSEPTKVTIVGESSGWLKIKPVAGCFCFVNKNEVKDIVQDSSGIYGIISGNGVAIHTGGDMRKSECREKQAFGLAYGTKVKILEEVLDKDGTWFKIAPPEGTIYWISRKFVNTGAQADTAGGSATTRPAGEKDTVAGPTDPQITAYKELEKKLIAEFEKPAGQRNLQALVIEYKKLDLPANSSLKKSVDSTINFLIAQINLDAALVNAAAIDSDTQKLRQETEKVLAEYRADEKNPKIFAYMAEGIVIPSDIYTGEKGMVKRYQLRDPATQKTNAYIQSSGGQVDLDKYAGKYIGVFGQSTYIKDLGLSVIDISDETKVKVLNTEGKIKVDPQAKTTYVPAPTAPTTPSPQPTEKTTTPPTPEAPVNLPPTTGGPTTPAQPEPTAPTTPIGTTTPPQPPVAAPVGPTTPVEPAPTPTQPPVAEPTTPAPAPNAGKTAPGPETMPPAAAPTGPVAPPNLPPATQPVQLPENTTPLTDPQVNEKEFQ